MDPQGQLSLADIGQKIKERDHDMRSIAGYLHSAYTHVYRSAKGGLLAVV